jgi:hypothetical protein
VGGCLKPFEHYVRVLFGRESAVLASGMFGSALNRKNAVACFP